MQREPVYGYGVVFRRDHRIHSIPDGQGGRRRLPINGGLPLRSVGYFGLALGVMLLLSKVWGIGFVVGLLPWPAFVVLPIGAAYALTQVEPDGRSALRYVATWVWHRLAPAEHVVGRPLRPVGRDSVYAPLVAIAADPAFASAALPSGVVHGPARITFRDPVWVQARRSGQHTARSRPARQGTLARAVELDVGEQLRVRP